MRWVAAPLAAVLAALALAGCGGDGAEPGASEEATLVLDFQPNAVHAGIYDALARGYLSDRGAEAARGRPGAVRDPRHPRPRPRSRAWPRRRRRGGDRPAPAGGGDRGR